MSKYHLGQSMNTIKINSTFLSSFRFGKETEETKPLVDHNKTDNNIDNIFKISKAHPRIGKAVALKPYSEKMHSTCIQSSGRPGFATADTGI